MVNIDFMNKTLVVNIYCLIMLANNKKRKCCSQSVNILNNDQKTFWTNANLCKFIT